MSRFKRIAFMTVGIIAVALVVWLIGRFFAKPPMPETVPSSFPVSPAQPEVPAETLPEVETEESPETLYRRDTDGDTLPDWEEALWGTDAANADTDRDGVLDNEEVGRVRSAGESPARDLIPRVMQPIAPTMPPTFPRRPERRSETERETAPSAAEQPKVSPPRLSSLETLALRAYAENTNTVIQRYASQWQEEVDAFESFATTSARVGSNTGLREIADDYRARADALAAITPPESARVLHETLIARYRGQADAIDHIASFSSFETTTKEEWNAYGDAVISAGTAYYDLAQFLQSRNASF